MQFGVCGDPGLAAVAAIAGYDYAEWAVEALLKPRQSEDEFHAVCMTLSDAALPYPVANCFVPGDLKITGLQADEALLRDYVTTVMDRAERLGIRIIVFGSGGARQIPEGFDVERAHDQLVSFCRMAGPLAHDHGVTVVVEPLNKTECNVLTTVGECAALLREVDHVGIRLLVDAYHLMRDNDDYEDIVRHGDLLAHVHIATVPGRLAPAAESCDFTSFFTALARAGYTDRISIEGGIPAPETDLILARDFMCRLNDSAQAES